MKIKSFLSFKTPLFTKFLPKEINHPVKFSNNLKIKKNNYCNEVKVKEDSNSPIYTNPKFFIPPANLNKAVEFYKLGK